MLNELNYIENYQKIASFIAVFFGFLGLGCLAVWTGGKNKDIALLGGYDFNTLIFNFHPLFMYSGLILFALGSILTFKFLPGEKIWKKKIHGTLHTFALLSAIIGLICVLSGNNNKSKNDSHAYYPNFYSLHSFIGILAIVLYFQNYALGIYHFLTSFETVSLVSRYKYRPIHAFLGITSFALAVLAVETGIMELTTELNCTYTVDKPDTVPLLNYHLLKFGCKLAHGIGLSTILCSIFSVFALQNFQISGNTATTEEERYLLERTTRERTDLVHIIK